MIIVEKINEAQLRVYSSDFGIEQEISEYFKFRPHGYQFVPSFKNKMWNGWLYLYSQRDKVIPFGLLPYVKLFAEKYEYPIELCPDLMVTPKEVSRKEVKTFIDSLDIHSNGKKLDIRDYQYEAVYQSLNQRKLICQSPTSSGKSLIIYVIIRWILKDEKKIVLTVPTTSLVNQMFTDFEDYSSENGFDVSEFCHMLYSGKEKLTNHPVLISTYQSLHSMSKNKEIPKSFFTQWNALIGDEVHQYVAKTLQELSIRLVNCEYRIGTTGTVQDEKVSRLQLEGSFGPIYKTITTKELIDRKQVADLKIKCLILEHPKDIAKMVRKVDYQKEMVYIVSDPRRNRFIANLAKSVTGNTLVLFQYVEKHGKPLFDLIKERCPDRPVFYISGETKTDLREEIRTGMSKFNNAIIVASSATVATGTNIPSIENIIFASPTKSKIRNLQSIGRGIRLAEGKDYCTLYDIADSFGGGTKSNGYTFEHFKERLSVYNGEEFDFTINTVNL